MSIAETAPPRSAVEALLATRRALDLLQRRDPSASGRLRLRLTATRREWRSGQLSDRAFDVVLAEIIDLAGASIRTG